MKKTLFLTAILIGFFTSTFAQSDSTTLKKTKAKINYAEETFEAPRIILGQSVESPEKGDLILNIQHHFGYVNQGAYEFFGLDQATIRLGFQYGITDWLMVGIGRSSYGKTIDGNFKVKLLRQSTGGKNMPVSVSLFASMGITTLHPQDIPGLGTFNNRLSFLTQVLVARKFSDKLSLQLSPSLVHRNLVQVPGGDKNVFAMGAGGRFKISHHTSLDLEYFAVLSQKTASLYKNSLSVGFNIAAGGHVFQLYVSNSEGITGQNFIPSTFGDWLKGDIMIGFNITRRFHLIRPKYY